MLILPDDFAEEDLIGNKPYCDGLVDVVRSIKSRGSFTIGIYGNWGLGKTSLLRQIKHVLDNSSGNSDESIRTVWFNPWQFVADEHLIVPFVHTVIAALGKDAETSAIGKIGLGILRYLEKATYVPLSFVSGMEVESSELFPVKVKMSGGKVLDYQQKKEEAVDKKAAQVNETNTAFNTNRSAYYDLIQTLQDTASKSDLKVVVFIDDLDRCLPERAVQLLEGLKVLLNLPGFVFVIGVAREIIERGIHLRYRELYKDGPSSLPLNIEEQYLDKIIQFPFTLPTPDADKIKQNLLKAHLRELTSEKRYVDLIHDVLGNNPRTLKRFINTISFAEHLAKKQPEETISSEVKIGMVRACLIGYVSPDLYRHLEKSPGHLVRIQEIIRKAEEDKKQRKASGAKGTRDEFSERRGRENWLAKR